jgi:hypothetical protein
VNRARAAENCNHADRALAAAHRLTYSSDLAAPVIRDETNGGEMPSIRAEPVT